MATPSAAQPIDYVAELLTLRETYCCVAPQARYNTIRQRLSHAEIGPTKLVSAVSAVEGLARSIAVHRKARGNPAVLRLYAAYRDRAPTTLVEEVLKSYHAGPPSQFFSGDAWPLFRHAVNYRNLIVHECTYLGQDRYPSLINASLDVLDAIAQLAGLRARGA